jgi:hypothetical protein
MGMASTRALLEHDGSRASVGRMKSFTVTPTHVFAFPRSGTTSLSEWLGKDNASHEYNMTAVARLYSDVGKLDPLSWQRFLTARELGLAGKTDITTNLFVFAKRYIEETECRPLLLLRNPVAWCASFFDMFAGIGLGLQKPPCAAEIISALHAWGHPPWGSQRLRAILLETRFLDRRDLQEQITAEFLLEWCDHAKSLLDLSINHHFPYITTSMFDDPCKIAQFFPSCQGLADRPIPRSNSGQHSQLIASIIKRFVTVDLQLSGNAADDRDAIEHFHGVLKTYMPGEQFLSA